MSSLVKWHKGGLKSPLSRARGLGSAKSGLEHWLMQRITAVGNLILTLWLLWSIVTHGAMTYTDAILWLSEPMNAVLMILFVICTFYHAVLGIQVIVEDYIHHEGFKLFKLLGQRLVFFAMGVACIFSILQVAL
jgi:succinate dehydrogenase / fumarate reductase membrane anchor subunit